MPGTGTQRFRTTERSPMDCGDDCAQKSPFVSTVVFCSTLLCHVVSNISVSVLAGLLDGNIRNYLLVTFPSQLHLPSFITTIFPKGVWMLSSNFFSFQITKPKFYYYLLFLDLSIIFSLLLSHWFQCLSNDRLPV